MADTEYPPLTPTAQLLDRIDRGMFRVESMFNLASALVILMLMLLAVVQVVGRKAFDLPIRGYVDWVEFAMAIFAFLSIAYTQRLGGHVRMEFFIGRFSGRLLWGLEIIGTLIAMFVIVVLAWYGYTHFLRAWNIGDSSIDIQLVIWPGKLVVVIAFISLQLRLWVQLAGFIRLFFHPDAQPVAVPIIETVDEQAQHEIDAGLAGEDEKVDVVARGVQR